jgi:putative exporter of polyketide antibiotics
MPKSNASRLKPPPSYLVLAIASTAFCCLPFGLIALVHAVQVHWFLQKGDEIAAQQASKTSKLWCMIAIGSGFAGLIFGALSFLDHLSFH